MLMSLILDLNYQLNKFWAVFYCFKFILSLTLLKPCIKRILIQTSKLIVPWLISGDKTSYPHWWFQGFVSDTANRKQPARCVTLIIFADGYPPPSLLLCVEPLDALCKVRHLIQTHSFTSPISFRQAFPRYSDFCSRRARH